MRVTVNLKQLYEQKHELWNSIKRHVDGRMFGTETIDVGQAFAEAIQRFQEANPIELWEEEQAAEKRAEDKRQEVKDEAEATERVKFWFSCGLIANDFNKDVFRKILEANNARFNAFNVDLCVNKFRDKFQWQQVKAPEPPPPPPPPPVLIDDPESATGKSEQLPLGTQARHRHTKAQLRDLYARQVVEQAKQVRESNNAVAAAFAEANKPLAVGSLEVA